MLDLNNIRSDLNKLSNRLDTTNTEISNRLDTTSTVGFALILGLFIVSRIDKREMKEDMRISKLEMKEDMEKLYNQTRADYIQTRADMKEIQIETQTNNRLTLLIAVLAIVIPILTK
jgi:uncharacterized protein YneF (UPF0154 family)